MIEEQLVSHTHSVADLPVSKSHKRNLFIVVALVFVLMFIGIISTFPSSSAIEKASQAVKETVDFSDEQVPAKVHATMAP